VGIESTTLANGLKVVIAPGTTAPVVTVGVYYKNRIPAGNRKGASDSRIFSNT